MFVENTHPEPTKSFAISSRDQLHFINAQAFIHSHPNGVSAPSAADMQVQEACVIPFGVCHTTEYEVGDINWWGSYLLDKPLEGRRFVHGIFDCYSLVRSYYHQNLNIKLKEIPRNFNWWEQGDDLFMSSFQNVGFSVVEQPQPNDLILMQIASHVINHTGIFLQDNLMLHHIGSGVSCKEYVTKYAKRVKLILRYQ